MRWLGNFSRIVISIFSVCTFAAPGAASVAAAERSASATGKVLVQLFEWPWDDIARECKEVLGPSGIYGVQVSPPNEHIDLPSHPWWERYQIISYKLHTRSGGEQSFREMVRACRKAGVEIYVDVIFNHMSGFDSGRGFAGSPFEHKSYPGLWSSEDFHSCGRNGNDNIENFKDLFELQFCQLLNLADLATEKFNVRRKLADYVNRLAEIGVRGLRVDAAKHMPAQDIKSILSMVHTPLDVYQELILSPGEPVQPGPYLEVGSIMLFAFPYVVGEAFQTGDPRILDRLFHFGPHEKIITFIENHDLQRSPDPRLMSYIKDPQLYKLAQTFLLAWPLGTPKLYSSYRFAHYDDGPPLDSRNYTLPVLKNGRCTGPWLCEHRKPAVKEMVAFRKYTTGYRIENFWTNENGVLAFSLGNRGMYAMNLSKHERTVHLPTSLPNGSYCSVMEPACERPATAQNGGIELRIPAQSFWAAISQ